MRPGYESLHAGRLIYGAPGVMPGAVFFVSELYTNLSGKIVYKDITFSATADTPGGGNSFITVSISASGQGLTGYEPVALTIKDGNQVGNGMVYHPHMASNTSCYIRAENLQSSNAYRASGTLRVLYLK